jgi:hypothetical protein
MCANIKILLLCLFITQALSQQKGFDHEGQLVPLDSKYRVKEPVSAREILL